MAQIRKKARLSQRELAARISSAGHPMTQVQLSHYELGKNKVPASIISAAAKAIGCDVGEFF